MSICIREYGYASSLNIEYTDILLAEQIGQIFMLLLFLAELNMVAVQKHF
jgi:hypothetical protein